jgi:hypothetical protein
MHIAGHFSDNLVTLDPCNPRPLCFTWEPSQTDEDSSSSTNSSSGVGDAVLDVEEFKKTLTWMDLSDSTGPQELFFG